MRLQAILISSLSFLSFIFAYSSSGMDLKPFHVQQDKLDGCSLATSLMLINALQTRGNPGSAPLTQEEFRHWLLSKGGLLRQWHGRVNGKGIGVSLQALPQYLQKAFSELGYPQLEIRKIQRKNVTLAQFRRDLLNASSDPNVIILLNYSAHWSPLGHYAPQTDSMLIYDVNFDDVFGREYSYGEGQGEVTVKASSFHRKWSKRRGYLKIIIK